MSLRAVDLRFGYGNVPVLGGITLTVFAGEFLAVLGPNGSGKSTLLRLLSRVHRPGSGRVLLAETDLWRLAADHVAREMTVVAQETGLNFDFTVAELVMLGRTPHIRRWSGEGAEDRRACREALRLCRLEGLADRPVTELSGGERRRVFLAAALAQETGILLLDEPTSHLDIGYQLEILDLLRRLQKERARTVVAVLHDMNLAARYADRIMLMAGGRMVAMGTPAQVLTADNIGAVYGIEVLVEPHPVFGHPCIFPLRRTGAAGGAADA